MSAQEIATAAGLPVAVVIEKLGITRKHVGAPSDQPNDMAVQAALDCLRQSEIAASEIDVVLCTTEEWKEYLAWTAGIDLAHRIGADRAWAMDIHMRCATTVGALKVACDLMHADPAVRTVLIAGGYRLSDFIDFQNPRSSFMFNIGAGAGALLLRRGYDRNAVLGAHVKVDGSLSRAVVIPASGTMRHPTDAAVRDGAFYLDVVEPDYMKDRLNAVSMDNWLECLDRALEQAGHGRADIDFLNMLLVKPSAHRAMLERLGLAEEQSVYLGDIGHIGEHDAMFGIKAGLTQGRLKDGKLMAILAAGIGYVWAAAIVSWGPVRDWRQEPDG